MVGDTSGLGAAVLHPGRKYGMVLVLNHVRGEFGLPGILGELSAGRRFAFIVMEVVKAIVFAQVLGAYGGRATVKEWLSRVFAPEFEGIEAPWVL